MKIRLLLLCLVGLWGCSDPDSLKVLSLPDKGTDSDPIFSKPAQGRYSLIEFGLQNLTGLFANAELIFNEDRVAWNPCIRIEKPRRSDNAEFLYRFHYTKCTGTLNSSATGRVNYEINGFEEFRDRNGFIVSDAFHGAAATRQPGLSFIFSRSSSGKPLKREFTLLREIDYKVLSSDEGTNVAQISYNAEMALQATRTLMPGDFVWSLKAEGTFDTGPSKLNGKKIVAVTNLKKDNKVEFAYEILATAAKGTKLQGQLNLQTLLDKNPYTIKCNRQQGIWDWTQLSTTGDVLKKGQIEVLAKGLHELSTKETIPWDFACPKRGI